MSKTTLKIPDPTKVLTEVKAIIKDENYTMKQVAAQSGMSVPTLSQVLNDKYPGDVEDKITSLQNWINVYRVSKEINEQVGDEIGYLETPTAKQCKTILNICFATGDMGAIVGPPGRGKTSTARQMAEENSRAYYICADETRSKASVIISEILMAIALPIATRHIHNLRVLEDFLKNFPALIMIDEAQKLSMGAFEQLRSIHDRTGCGIVFMGNSKVISSLTGGSRPGDFAQLSSRAGMRYTIPAKLPEEDATMLLDAMGIEHSKTRAHLVGVAQSHGALRAMKKVIKHARLNQRVTDGPAEFHSSIMAVTRARAVGGARS